MPRIHLTLGRVTVCGETAMRIDMVDDKEFARMMRDHYGTLCPHCKDRVELKAARNR